jgi:HTH-type transcriptional regulator, competence development regulator
MKKVVTEVGRFLRKLRIDSNEVLYDMAKKLGCTSAFISSLELGKRPVPLEFQRKVVEVYSLNAVQQEEFQKVVEQSLHNVTIPLDDLGDSSKKLALVFARRLKTMGEKDAEKMLKYLAGGNKNNQ